MSGGAVWLTQASIVIAAAGFKSAECGTSTYLPGVPLQMPHAPKGWADATVEKRRSRRVMKTNARTSRVGKWSCR
jgi:hypothetical protein